ncbi:SnoaL-like domain-containing protein [Madurella fahalii]|uniref:SnoaL-like domain-containing protein n=1 Tax=Madurella fahalii TaxID=1157608 RepID=A0ABQ0G3D9_9PEZI
MAFELHIPPCISNPAHPLHPPPPEKPLRIQIEGPPAGPEIAKLVYRTVYGRDARPELANDMVVRDEYLGWVTDKTPYRAINYYGVTFDHLVPADDPDPEVLQINIIELEIDSGPFAHGGAYANEYLLFAIDPADYIGKKVLAVPRCCQKRKGTQDRMRVNSSVVERDRG